MTWNYGSWAREQGFGPKKTGGTRFLRNNLRAVKVGPSYGEEWNRTGGAGPGGGGVHLGGLLPARLGSHWLEPKLVWRRNQNPRRIQTTVMEAACAPGRGTDEQPEAPPINVERARKAAVSAKGLC